VAPQDRGEKPGSGRHSLRDPGIVISRHAEEKQPMISFSTPRLVLRRPEESDIAPLMAMDADPEVMRYIGTGAIIPPDRDRALQAVTRWRKQWDEQGFGMCSAIVRETGDYAGWVALAVPAFLPEILPAVEIGYRLRREYWGQGYATEAAAEVLRFGFTGAGLDRVVSIRDIDNVRSERVMEKLGLRFECRTTVPATGQLVAVHAIARDEFGPHDGSPAK
jgi:RimJ/RimL family protein N-acetyltransferase